MKRVIVLLLLAALAAPAFAQFVPGSMENGMTMGLFENEIDQAFQANPDFGLFANSFLFAGLGNPMSGLWVLGNPFGEADAFDTTFTAPLKIGYYMAGSLPISFYSSADFTALAARHILGTTTANTYATEPVVTGTTTTNYRWLQESEEFTSTDVIRASAWQADLQALTKLGPAVFGLYLYLDADNSAADLALADGYFVDYTNTFNDTTSAPGVIPVVALDYTISGSIKNVNPAAPPAPLASGLYAFLDTFRVGVPFAMRTGNLEHRAYVDLTFGSTDSSAAYSVVESAHALNAGGAAVDDQTLDITSKTTSTDIAAHYGLAIPAGAAGNEWRATLNLNVGLNGREYAYDDLLRPYNLSVLAAKTALAGGSHTVVSSTYAAGIDFGVTLGGARVFAFEPAKGIAFRFAPSLSFGFDSIGGAARLTGRTGYTAPLDAAGAVDATVAYNTVTTTVTGDPAKSCSITVGAGLPMGLTLKPVDWKFGFILGATPAASVTATTLTSSGETTTVTTVNTTGATVNTTAITSTIATPNSTSTMDYSFSEDHYIGITVPFDGGVRFDARLNGSLLNFESFTIQAFVPLK
jgi:hypothetical protein